MLSAIVLGFLCAATPSDAPLLRFAPSANTRVLQLSQDHPTAQLRADFARPDRIVLVTSDYWPETWNQVRATLAADVPVIEVTATYGPDADNITQLRYFTDTPWVRDYGPLQRVRRNGTVERWLDLSYEPLRPRDDALPIVLAGYANVPMRRVPVWIDGGGLASNGHGLCVCTWATLYAAQLAALAEEPMRLLLQELGCQSLVVVPSLALERTGHIDTVLQFASESRAVLAESDSETVSPADTASLQEIRIAVQAAAAALKQPLEIIAVPLSVYDGVRYQSYVNGVVTPKHFVAPHFETVDAALEARAYAALAKAYALPVVGVPSDEMMRLGGALHCVTVGINVK